MSMEDDQLTSIKDFDVLEDDIYYSILLPLLNIQEIRILRFISSRNTEKVSRVLENDSDEGGKNMYEELFLRK